MEVISMSFWALRDHGLGIHLRVNLTEAVHTGIVAPKMETASCSTNRIPTSGKGEGQHPKNMF